MIKKHQLTNIIIAFTLLLSLTFSLGNSTSQVMAQVQPALVQLATDEPDSMVRIMVRGDDNLQSLVAELGGVIVHDLSIIDALAVEMSAEAAVTLTLHDSVNWVSLDAPVKSAGNSTFSVRDEFSTVSFSNNDGDTNWSSDWIETGEGGGPYGGDIRINGTNLRIKDDNRSIEREVNLSGATSAILRFDYRRKYLDKSSDYFTLDISTNGGSTWTEIDRFAGPNNDSYFQEVDYDISAYASSNTRIRFKTSSSLGNSDKLYIDDLEIEFTTSTDDSGSDSGSEIGEAHAETVRDDFNNSAFNGNNGSLDWGTDWLEINEASGPGTGDIEVEHKSNYCFDQLCLMVEANGTNGIGASRQVDLDAASSATLSFVYQHDNDGGLIELQVSPDGFSWTTIQSFSMSYNSGSQWATFDLTPFMTAATQIRFIVMETDEGRMGIDNIEIAYVVEEGITDSIESVNSLTVRDEFNSTSYSGNDGTSWWATGWIESGDDGSAGGGEIEIETDDCPIPTSRCIEYDGDANINSSIERQVNLSGVAFANLTFDYHLDKDNVVFVLEVSTDGGNSWVNTPLRTFNTQAVNSEIVDLTPYTSTNTRIRFRLASSVGGGHISIDNVEIAYSSSLPNTYLSTLNVWPVWGMGLQGQGVGIAVIDSGITAMPDFGGRVTQQISINNNSETVNDVYGHGTHVAGISAGQHTGIAPQADLISLQISDETGMAYESDTVAAMQWVLNNKDAYNIRVVNLSVNSTLEGSYHDSPMDAAAEILWFNGIVVVASAGNKGPGGGHNTANASPANDPFIITVGASDEHGTTNPWDDSIAPFSAHGTTVDGHSKPDIIAPGKDIVSVLSNTSTWGEDHPKRVVFANYFRLSGTSMSAPMVTGAVALILQNEPGLTPDQVKYRLMNAGNTIANYSYLDVNAAVTGGSTESANTGLTASQMLWSGSDPVTWNSVNWNSVNWNSVNWNSVNWNSVNWNSVNWNSVNWND